MMRLIKSLVGLCLLTLSLGCGVSSDWPVENEGSLFYVETIDPLPQSALTSIDKVVVGFSQPVLASSIGPDTLFVVQEAVYASYAAEDWEGLGDDAESGSVTSIGYAASVDATGRFVTLLFNQALEQPETYVVVALPSLQSTDYYPLDQTATGMGSRVFSSSFLIAGTGETSNADTPTQSVSYPEVASGTAGFSETEEDTGTGGELLPLDWSRVLLTEIVTDPQQDHSDSEGGNGIGFDATPGTGTVSSTDEYLEVYNGTGNVVDLTLWSLVMADGTDVTQGLGDDAWDTCFSLESADGELAPGEFAVFGNPGGTINNNIVVTLLNENAEVVDIVTIEDANATGIDDEAYFLGPDGIWGQGPASPGGFEE